ncbi:MAG: hypothetical protein RR324_01140 [Cellulosilyticaceae bacterium]
MSKFELSLSSNYVANWTIIEAVREFFQNALDQQTQEEHNEMFFDYDESTETLSIGNKSSVLEARTLLMGCSSKTNDANTIGQFGEGYKVATLVALREGKSVVFYNYGKKEIWKPRMVKSRKYGADVLTFFTESFVWKKAPSNNLIITIDNISKDEYQEIVETNLHLNPPTEVLKTSRGEIILDEDMKGKVFVNGLFVNSYEEMHFGYNILPKYIKLDRDRRAVNGFDLHFQSSKMWASTEDKRVAEYIKKGYADVEYITQQYEYDVHRSVKEQAYQDFKEEYGEKAVPVSNQTELEAVQQSNKELKPVVVNSSLQKVIETAPTYKQPEAQSLVLSMEDKLCLWMIPLRDKLTDEEIEAFLEIIDRTEEDLTPVEEEEDNE